METLAAPGGGLPLAASVADVAALVAELIAVFAVSVAELAFSEADLSLEQPVSPPITIAGTPPRPLTHAPPLCLLCVVIRLTSPDLQPVWVPTSFGSGERMTNFCAERLPGADTVHHPYGGVKYTPREVL